MRSIDNVMLISLPALILLLGVEVGGIFSNYFEKYSIFVFIIPVAFSLNTAIYCGFPVHERDHKLKYIMEGMGLRIIPYWLGMLLFDMLAITAINGVQLVCYNYIYNQTPIEV